MQGGAVIDNAETFFHIILKVSMGHTDQKCTMNTLDRGISKFMIPVLAGPRQVFITHLRRRKSPPAAERLGVVEKASANRPPTEAFWTQLELNGWIDAI